MTKKVEMRLVIGPVSILLAQTGPDSSIVNQGIAIEPTEAKIEVVIDGKLTSYDVFLPNGLSSEQLRFSYVEKTTEPVEE